MRLRINSFHFIKNGDYKRVYIICINHGMFLPDNYNTSKYLVNLLNINEDDLRKILILYDAKFDRIIDGDYYFSNKEDAEKCLSSPELEPYLIMLELCEEQE